MSWNNLTADDRELYTEILTPIQLEIFRHRLNGHSWRTIASALARDEATIRGHHRRAIERIRRHLEETETAA